MIKTKIKTLSMALACTLLFTAPASVMASADTPSTDGTSTETTSGDTTSGDTTSGNTTVTTGSTSKIVPLVKFKKNRTYKKYDITGDSKKDRFQYTVDDDELTIKINKKVVYTSTSADKYTVKLCTLENGKVYINIAEEWDDNTWQKQNLLYQYKKGKLRLTNTLLPLPAKRYQTTRSDVVSVKGNQITVRYTGITTVAGKLQWQGIYKYKTSTKKLKRSNTMDSYYTKKGHPNAWKVSKRFQTYTMVNGTVKSFKTGKNEIVKINRVFNNGKSMWLQIVRNNEITGWIKCPKTVKRATQYFANINY